MKHSPLVILLSLLIGLASVERANAQRVAMEGDRQSDVLFAYSGRDKRTVFLASGRRKVSGVMSRVERVTLISRKNRSGVIIDFDRNGLPSRITGSDGSSILLTPSQKGRFFTARFLNPNRVQVGPSVRFAARSRSRTRSGGSELQLPSVSSALRSLPRDLAGVDDVQLRSLLGDSLGSEISGMLDLFGDTVEKIITRVAKVGASIRTPIVAARQIGEDFFEDILGEMVSNDATGRIQIALDVRDVIGGELPDVDQVSRLSSFGQKLLKNINSGRLPVADLPPATEAGATRAGFISFRAFYPRPDGIDAESWQQAAAIVQQQLAAQGVNLGDLAPIVSIQFLASGLLAEYTRLPVDDIVEARQTILQLYGSQPWQLTGPTIETR